MPESLFSPSWYRVAALKPRVRAHGQIHRHDYRGRVWYVLQDHAAGQHHRFTPSAHRLIGLMDGSHTVQQLWDIANAELGDDAPTQDETIRLLAQLHAADLLQSDVSPDAEELLRRYQKQRRRRWVQRLSYPLALHVPLFDPERLLVRGLPFVRPLFGRLGAAVWLAVVVTGAVLAASHWAELTENIADRALAPENLLLVWLAYPLVKALHEFGHAFAVKVWGGEVHEMGFMLLVLVPVPYVEASAASAFRDKWKRVVVGGAGIMVELFLAALALFVWIDAEPGTLIRAFAYNVMLIGGVSTLFFNGNPLLRFDGYYVMADLIEIPNLATRSRTYLRYLVDRYLFAVADADSPVTARGESVWLGTYGVASLAYRVFIVVAIILLVADRFFIVGGLIAVWAAVTQGLTPIAKSLSSVFRSSRLQRQRRRAVATTAALVGAGLVLIFLVPLPSWTRAEGVVWLPAQSRVRAGADGFVVRLLAAEGSRVRRGMPLIESEDPLLPTQVRVLEARVSGLEARLRAQEPANRALADATKKELASVRAELSQARERLDSLVVHSPVDGTFVVPEASDLPGRFVRRGEMLGYVANSAEQVLRVVVGQDDIGLVRERTREVEVALADWDARPVPARIVRAVPAASEALPSKALGGSGGGALAVDPRDPTGLRTLENVFEYDLALPDDDWGRFVGQRVYVRFDHGYEALGRQLFRAGRQLFLSRFGI